MSATFATELVMKRSDIDSITHGSLMSSVAIPGIPFYYFQLGFFSSQNHGALITWVKLVYTSGYGNNSPPVSPVNERVTFHLYNRLGHIIGVAHSQQDKPNRDKWSWQPIKMKKGYCTSQDLKRHFASETPEEKIIVQCDAVTNVDVCSITGLKDILMKVQDPQYLKEDENAATNKAIKLIISGKDVTISAGKVNSLMTKSEFFCTLITKYRRDLQITEFDDIDPKVFELFVELVHFDKWLYRYGAEDIPTLQECCREMLVIANKWMCVDLAKQCADCIIHGTTKNSLFDDIYLLDAHYNGEDKIDRLGQLAMKIRSLNPDDKEENLKLISKRLTDVSYAFLLRLLTDSNKKPKIAINLD